MIKPEIAHYIVTVIEPSREMIVIKAVIMYLNIASILAEIDADDTVTYLPADSACPPIPRRTGIIIYPIAIATAVGKGVGKKLYLCL